MMQRFTLRFIAVTFAALVALSMAMPVLRAPALLTAPRTDGAPRIAGAPPTPDPLQLRDKILADPDLQHRAAPAQPLPAPDLPDINLSFLRWVILVAGAVVLVVLAVLLGPLLGRYFRRNRRGRPPALADAEVATSDEAIERARDASAVQDYRQALRLLYLAALLKLDEIGALRYDRALTNREYVREVALKSALAALLRPVVETFDDAWYGYRPVTPEGYGAFEVAVNALLRAAEEDEQDRS